MSVIGCGGRSWFCCCCCCRRCRCRHRLHRKHVHYRAPCQLQRSDTLLQRLVLSVTLLVCQRRRWDYNRRGYYEGRGGM